MVVKLELFPLRWTVPLAENLEHTSCPFRSRHFTVTAKVHDCDSPFVLYVRAIDVVVLVDGPNVHEYSMVGAVLGGQGQVGAVVCATDRVYTNPVELPDTE